MDIIDDGNQGTSIRDIKKHLNDIGYVPNADGDDEIQMKKLQQAQQQRDRRLYEEQQRKQYMYQQRLLQQQVEKPKQKKTKSIDANKDLGKFHKVTKQIKIEKEDFGNEEEKESGLFPTWIVDFILIVFLFVFVSNNTFQLFLSRHMSAVAPSSDGTIGLFGLIIYGVLMAVLYLLLKLIF